MRSKPFVLAALAAALVSMTTVGAVQAQDTRGVPPPKAKSKGGAAPDPAKAKEDGMAAAPGLLQGAGIACTVSDAAYGGSGKIDADGKKVDTKFYEVACSDAPGYILIAAEGQPTKAYDCLAMAKAAQTNPEGLTCKLPGNAEPFKGLQPVMAKAGRACTVTQARWAGANLEKKYDQYEVGCSEGMAYIVQLPHGGSSIQLTTLDCVRAYAQGVTCEYMPKDQVVAAVVKMAAPANRTSCQPTDVRYVGETQTKSTFYEVACADGKSGYVFQTDASGKFLTAVECARATMISGGCQLTTVATTPGEETGLYTKLITQMGYPCTVENYRGLGLDSATQREIVEVACAGKPASVIAFVPADKGAKGEIWNCVRAESRGLKCTLKPIEATYTLVTQQVSTGGKQCTVNKARGVGSTDTGTDFVEVGCEGGGALMIEYGPGMDVVKNVYNCAQAKGVGGGCKFLNQ